LVLLELELHLKVWYGMYSHQIIYEGLEFSSVVEHMLFGKEEITTVGGYRMTHGESVHKEERE
jgi:hypothetical protein